MGVVSIRLIGVTVSVLFWQDDANRFLETELASDVEEIFGWDRSMALTSGGLRGVSHFDEAPFVNLKR